MDKLIAMLQNLKTRTFSENIIEAREASNLFKNAFEQFPTFGDGYRANLYLLRYLAQLNLQLFQFQQSNDFLKAASSTLKERVETEESARDDENREFNLNFYAHILMLKAERCIRMHDLELGLRPLYKAYRVIKALKVPDKGLLISWYELMADLKVRQKELIQANEYLQKARPLQLELAKFDFEEEEQKRIQEIERKERIVATMMRT